MTNYYNCQQEENEKAGLFGNIGCLLGGVGGYLWLAPLLAGLGPLGLALAVGAGAGLGSWGGGKLGAAMNPDIDTKFAQSTHAQAEDNIKDQIKAKAINNAKNAAITASFKRGFFPLRSSNLTLFKKTGLGLSSSF